MTIRGLGRDTYGRLVAVFGCVLLASTAGCGYHFAQTGSLSNLPVRSLAVPPIKSPSSFPGFEGDVTGILQREFIAHSNLPIVAREEAEAVFLGEIHDIRAEASGYSVTQVPLQGQTVGYEVTNRRRLRLKLSGKVVLRRTGEVIWEDREMEEIAFYAVGSDPMTNRYNERKAIQDAARRLARRVFSSTVERF